MKLAGWRNVMLIVGFFAWSTMMVRIFEPPKGDWTPELISATGTFLGTTGITFVGMIIGRAVNKYADSKKGSNDSAQ